MSDDIHHECGIAALYRLEGTYDKCTAPDQGTDVVVLMPRMLLDMQTRGQLAAGFTTYNSERAQLIDTFKDMGTVSEGFRMSRPEKYGSILEQYAGSAAIGHTRYATTGADDVRYAQPFERQHGRLWKWFAFAFNGTLSNYTALRDKLVAERGYHFPLNTDTEIIMHCLAHGLRGDDIPDLRQLMESVSQDFDGAYSIVYLDALQRMFVARDPLGIRPMSWAMQGGLFAAASESVALTNLGFKEITTLAPGEMVIIERGNVRSERFSHSLSKARCFFEWVYFSNVASSFDGVSVYQTRAQAGHCLAAKEDQNIDDSCIVVPVPDTAKATADSFAYDTGIPCVE